MNPLMLYYSAAMVLHNVAVKNKAFTEATRLANGKGIINLGSGCNRTFVSKGFCGNPQVEANVDIAGGGPNFYEIDLEAGEMRIFSDHEFGCAFASHVLEHLENWEAALTEWSRIADYVIIVVPHPWSLDGQVWPTHKQHFTLADKAMMEQQWPSVKVFM